MISDLIVGELSHVYFPLGLCLCACGWGQGLLALAYQKSKGFVHIPVVFLSCMTGSKTHFLIFQCLGQSWYLANDMQFYILSPLIFMPLYLYVFTLLIKNIHFCVCTVGMALGWVGWR